MKLLTRPFADGEFPRPPTFPETDGQNGFGWRFFENPNDATQGPLMQVANYAYMYAGDALDAYWEDPDLAVVSQLLVAGDENLVTLRIPPSLILSHMGTSEDRVMDAWYRLTFMSGDLVTSARVKVRVKLNVPGKPLVDPERPYENKNLPAPELAPEIDLSVAGDIAVTIRKAANGPAWVNMVAGDVVTLYWGDTQWAQLPITDDDALAQAPLVITLTNAQVAEAGSGELKVFYGIRDIVGNWSRRSLVADVSVIGTDALPAPDIREDDLTGEVIDLTVPKQSADLYLHVPIYDGREPGDVVTVTWTGLKNEGVNPAPWTLTKTLQNPAPPHPQNFAVPIAEAEAIGEGTVTLRYSVERAGGGKAISRRKTYTVTGGSEQTLAMPIILEAKADELAPWDTADGAHIQIKAYRFMAAGDRVTLKWNGVTATGVATTLVQEAEIETADLGSDLSFIVDTLDVDAIAGGSLTLSYTVVQDMTTFDSAVATFTVGARAWSLVPPEIPEAVSGALSPNAAATVRIGSYDAKTMGDRVTFSWIGEPAAGDVETLIDSQDLDAAMALLPVDFPIDAADVGRLAGGRVSVSYTVENFGGIVRASRIRELIVQAGSALLPAPTVREAIGDVLDPLSAPDGATVVVPANVSITPGHQVTANWNGAAGQGSFTTSAKPGDPAGMEFIVPVSVIVRNFGSRVDVTYSVSEGEDAIQESLPASVA